MMAIIRDEEDSPRVQDRCSSISQFELSFWCTCQGSYHLPVVSFILMMICELARPMKGVGERRKFNCVCGGRGPIPRFGRSAPGRKQAGLGHIQTTMALPWPGESLRHLFSHVLLHFYIQHSLNNRLAIPHTSFPPP